MRDENRRVLLGKSIPWETWVWGVRLRLCTWLMGDFYSTTRLQLQMPGSSLCSLYCFCLCSCCHLSLCPLWMWGLKKSTCHSYTIYIKVTSIHVRTAICRYILLSKHKNVSLSGLVSLKKIYNCVRFIYFIVVVLN